MSRHQLGRARRVGRRHLKLQRHGAGEADAKDVEQHAEDHDDPEQVPGGANDGRHHEAQLAEGLSGHLFIG